MMYPDLQNNLGNFSADCVPPSVGSKDKFFPWTENLPAKDD